MDLELAHVVASFSNHANFQQGDSKQRDNSKQVEANRDHVGNAAPLAGTGDGNDCVEEKIEEDTQEIEADTDPGQTVEFLQVAGEITLEQDKQLGDCNELCQDDRDGHENDQVPGLVL